MDKNIYLSNLFDYYSPLLTEKQKNYFIDYYFNNLTLSELSENYNVSRNAIHKSLKDIEEKLIFYEENLSLYSKSLKIKKIISNLDDDLKNRIDELI